MMRISLWIATFALILQPRIAASADGVIEINQAAALAGGITPGDSPGFPVTLSRSGSYRLTGNLNTNSRATSALDVFASDVTIDLNGFTIACTFSTGPILPVGCLQGTTGGGGVTRSVSSLRTVVRNGSVRDMGAYGVAVGDYGRVEAVRAVGNSFDGINAGDFSTVKDCHAIDNRSEGITVGVGSTVTGNEAIDNDVHGFLAGDGSTLIGNVARNNGNHGIRVDFVSGSERVGAAHNALTGNPIPVSFGVLNLGGNLCGAALCP